MSKIDWGGFFSNFLAVVLGIFITFWIQGLIDRRAEKKDVKSALALVKEELINNKNGLQDVIDILVAEKNAAEYIRDNIRKITPDDADTLLIHSSVLSNEYFCTITDDALELLKTSSLFQKMGDNSLALSIIQAYDYLNMNAQAFNTHEKYKTSLFNDVNTDRVKKAALQNSGLDYLKIVYSSKESDYFLKSVIDMSDDSFLKAGLPEIGATIAAIESRL